MCMAWPCYSFFMVFLKNAVMCKKKFIYINRNCLTILMLLYIMLYQVHAYIMLPTALSNAVCLHNASFFGIDFCKRFLFSCFVMLY